MGESNDAGSVWKTPARTDNTLNQKQKNHKGSELRWKRWINKKEKGLINSQENTGESGNRGKSNRKNSNEKQQQGPATHHKRKKHTALTKTNRRLA